jgi:preprotein translocase subunit SecG
VLFATWADWVSPILNVLILLLGVFLILLVLIQRGKGGGLAGAFGGVGGSSAFGSRAGDQFTRITLVTAAIWMLLIMLMAKIVQPQQKQGPVNPEATSGEQQSRLWLPGLGIRGQESGVRSQEAVRTALDQRLTADS